MAEHTTGTAVLRAGRDFPGNAQEKDDAAEITPRRVREMRHATSRNKGFPRCFHCLIRGLARDLSRWQSQRLQAARQHVLKKNGIWSRGGILYPGRFSQTGV